MNLGRKTKIVDGDIKRNNGKVSDYSNGSPEKSDSVYSRNLMNETLI